MSTKIASIVVAVGLILLWEHYTHGLLNLTRGEAIRKLAAIVVVTLLIFAW